MLVNYRFPAVYLVFLFFIVHLKAQDKKFPALDEQFYDYNTVSFNTVEIMNDLSKNPGVYKTKMLGWDITLDDSGIIDERYQCVTFDGLKTTPQPKTTARAMNGYTSQGGRVSLTFNHHFIQGFIQAGMYTFYIEPVTNFDKNAEKDIFVVYNVKDIKPGEEKSCGVTEVAKETDRNRNNIGKGERVGLCYFVDYAIATDYSMFAHYGSTIAVQNHNIAVTNDMQTNYDTEFADAVQFVITQQFIVTTSNGDPWSNSVDGSVLLTSFRNWGPTGFTSVHDVGSLWTKRNFYALDVNGNPLNGVIGIAYTGQICTAFRYNILEDFSTNANSKRVLLAHELGHNFSAGHDTSSGFIMSPSVNNTSTWSATTINAIQSHYALKAEGLPGGCLAPCVLGPPQISFKTSATSILEYKGTGTTGTCNLPYKSYFIPVEVNKATTNTLTVAVSVASGNTSTEGSDFVIVNNTLTFPSGSQATQQIEVRIIDDALEESTENFTLQLSIMNGNAVLGTISAHTLTIVDADLVSATCCSPSDEVTYGSSPGSTNFIFSGYWEDARTRVLYLASQLTSSGLTAGYISSIQYLMGQKNSTIPYQNFRVGLANLSGTTTLAGMSWIATQRVYSGTITTPQANAWSEIVFDTPFYWDGTSSLYFEFCFDNQSFTVDDFIRYVNPGGTNIYFEAYLADGQSGCTLDGTTPSSSSNGNFQPHLKFKQLNTLKIESAVNSISKTELKVNEKANFYSQNGKIIASVKNLGSTDIGCIEASIETTGTGKLPLPSGGGDYTAKTFKITASPNVLYEVTLYYTPAELNTFGANANKLNIIKTQSTLATSNAGNSTLTAPDLVVTGLGSDLAYAYSGVFSGFSRFALTDRKVDTGSSIGGGDLVISEQEKGVILSNKGGTNYRIYVNNSGTIVTQLVTNPNPKAMLNVANFSLNSQDKKLVMRSQDGNYRVINISDTGILSTSVISLPAVRAQLTTGDLELENAGSGLIIKSTNGQCWRLFVNETGLLQAVNIICP